MARQYSAKTFLRNVPNALLEGYFTRREIDLGFRWSHLHETDVDPIFLALEKLPDGTRGEIDTDFRMINDLCSTTGVLSILDQATLWQQDLGDRFAEMKNAYERAFWTFLNEPHHFRIAGNFHEMDRRGGWHRRAVGEALEPLTDADTRNALRDRLRLIYRRQGRGKYCHVDYYFRRSPDRHCFFAYPEDHADTDLGFDERGRLQQRARRSAFEIIFVYRPHEGILELNARGKKNETMQLETAFCEIVLGLDGLPIDGRAPYDMRVLKDSTFSFPTEPEDRVAAVDIRQLRFDVVGVSHERITFSVAPRGSEPGALHQLIDRAIHRSKLPLHELTVSQARIRFTFEPVNCERPKTLTFEVTHPDRCSLRDDPLDQVAKKYLRHWGIARE
jgi:hypothetical protein